MSEISDQLIHLLGNDFYQYLNIMLYGKYNLQYTLIQYRLQNARTARMDITAFTTVVVTV